MKNELRGVAGWAGCGGMGILAGLLGIADKQMSWRGVDISAGQATVTGVIYLIFGIIILWRMCLKILFQSHSKVARRVVLALVGGAFITMMLNSIGCGRLAFVSAVFVAIAMSVVVTKGCEGRSR